MIRAFQRAFRESGAQSVDDFARLLQAASGFPFPHQTGLPVHAHAFRHTFATNYLRKGGEINRLRLILGHTTFKMTSRYVHMAGADLGRDIDDLVRI